jgi:hypothetical protein
MPDTNRGLLDLLLQLDGLGVELVAHHPGFLGVRRAHVRKVPDSVWDLIDRHEALLVQMIKRTSPLGRRHGKERTL